METIAETGSSDIDADFFSAEMQAVFWESFSPDIRLFLDANERRESWTYGVDEIPWMFRSIASALPKVAASDLDEVDYDSAQTVIRSLIPLLTSMPLRYCLSALSWLDYRGGDESVGWGVVCYMAAVDICESPEDEIYLYAKNLIDRVRLALRLKIATDLFVNLNIFGGVEDE